VSAEQNAGVGAAYALRVALLREQDAQHALARASWDATQQLYELQRGIA